MKSIENYVIEGNKYCIVSASIMGKDKVCNQDKYKVYSDSNQIICIMADGLGSAINSKEGATLICDLGIEIMRDMVDFSNLAVELRNSWIERLGFKPESCDTTFKFFILRSKEIIYGGIGDGWLNGVIDGKYFEKSIPDNFANHTESMMSIGYLKHFKVDRMKFGKIQALSLATDGFAEDMESNLIESFLLDSIREMNLDADNYASELEQLIENWPIKTNQDDKSVIILGGEVIE